MMVDGATPDPRPWRVCWEAHLGERGGTLAAMSAALGDSGKPFLLGRATYDEVMEWFETNDIDADENLILGFTDDREIGEVWLSNNQMMEFKLKYA